MRGDDGDELTGSAADGTGENAGSEPDAVGLAGGVCGHNP